jgi:cysteinyl-tRNA synthetase
MKKNLKLKNTLTNEKQQFVPLDVNMVKMYVCGITPYDYAHVGHGRCYVTFDVLYRLLKASGYDVTYVRNFTDIDDKLIARAQKELGDGARYAEVAQKFIDAYHEDLKNLNCLDPEHEPRVTETIPEIIEFIQGLIEKDHAYEVNGSVYFAVNSFDNYCKLSKRDVDDLRAGARVEVNSEKRNPLDFALWKAEEGDTFWQSPWGHGRPGWHIECSVMAKKLLGNTIDIHAGGMDLIFPHHENEIAQSEALHGCEFAKYWLHNAFVQIDKEKMSKSLGNFFTLRQVFEQFDPMVVRFMILNHHYRNPLDFSFDDLKVAEKTYQRLCKLFNATEPASKLDVKNPVIERMLNFLFDDLNTTGLLGVLFEHFKQLQEDQDLRAQVKNILVDLLGLRLIPLPEQEIVVTDEIEQLIAAREQARVTKDWARADELRDKLKELGYEVQDKKL